MAEMGSISRFFLNRSARRRAARLIGWVRNDVAVPPGARCLEIGCGNAEFASRFVDRFHPAQYVAVDVDPRQLEAARRMLEKRYARAIPDAIVLRPADMRELPFPDGSFHLVFAFVALHHASPSHRDFSEVPRALAEIRRVLQPGGSLVYQEFLHKQPIREWLSSHGFAVDLRRSSWRLEWVVARRIDTSPPSVAPSDVPGPTGTVANSRG